MYTHTHTHTHTHKQHVYRIIKYLTVLIFILTATILTPKELASQPPPLVVSVTHNSADCQSMSGQIVVQVTSSANAIDLEVTKNGSAYSFTQQNTSTPCTVTISNLDAGQYNVVVADNVNNQFTQTVNLDDNAVWPINCWTDDKAYGVDVITDRQDYVYAAGYFTGLLYIVPGSSSQMSSIGMHNIYLAKFSKCGKLVWEVAVGQANADCFVKAIAMDNYEKHLVMVGEIYPGDAIFQGNPSIVLSNTGTEKMAFIAKFDQNSGDVLWATPIKSYTSTGSSAEVTAEDIVTDNDGRIYVFGDFAGQTVELYSATGGAPSIGTNIAAQYRDNYLCVYKRDGGFLAKEIANVSSPYDEKAYSIDCIQSLSYPYDYEIYVAGLWWDTRFLLQRYTYPTPGLTKRTELFIVSPWSNDFTPKSVKCFHYQTGTQIGISVSGWKRQYNSSLFQDFLLPIMATGAVFTGVYPPIASIDHYEFVNSFPQTNNVSTCMDVNRTNFDHYMLGCINESGSHPVPGNNMNILTYPQSGLTVWNDFFVNKLKWVPAAFQQIDWALWSNSSSGIFYHQQADLPVFSISSDNDGKAYFTGSYRDDLSFAQPSLQLNAYPGGNTAFIARTYENSNQGIIKRDLISTASNVKNDISNCGFQFYPNPVSDVLTLWVGDFPEDESEICLYNTQGIKIPVSAERAASGELSLNLAGLPAGIYLIRLKSGGISCSQKVIKN